MCDLSDFLAPLAILVSASGASFFAHETIKTNRSLQQKRASTDRIDHMRSDERFYEAMECIHALHDEEGKKMIDLANGINDHDKELYKDVQEDHRKHLRFVNNIFEGYAIGIADGIYDELVIKKTIKTTYVRTWNNVQPYIYQVRKNLNNEHIYENFEELALKWQNEMPEEKRSGKIVHK